VKRLTETFVCVVAASSSPPLIAAVPLVLQMALTGQEGTVQYCQVSLPSQNDYVIYYYQFDVSSECSTGRITLGEYHKARGVGNRVKRGKLGSMKGEGSGGWRKLQKRKNVLA
jgi:hypothetical protein